MNAVDKLGLTALQILLAKLLDLAFIQNKPQEQRPARVCQAFSSMISLSFSARISLSFISRVDLSFPSNIGHSFPSRVCH